MLRSFVIGVGAMAALLLGAGSASATSFGCVLPEVAADVFWDSVEEELSEDTKTCEKQCKGLLKGCKGVVSAAEECFQAAVGALLDAESKGCGDIEDSEARKACTQEAKQNGKEFKQDLKEEVDSAKDECEATYEDCLDFCNGLIS